MPRYREPKSLTEAIYRKNQPAIDDFIARKEGISDCCPTSSGGSRKSPLELAVEQGNLPLMRRLIEAGASPSYSGYLFNPIETAIKEGNLDALKLLKEMGATFTQKDYLKKAVEHHNFSPKIIQWLIEQGLSAADMSKRDYTLIHSLLFRNESNSKVRAALDILLEAGADPTIPGPVLSDGTRIHSIVNAIASGDPYLVDRLLDSGCDPNTIMVQFEKNIDGRNCPLIVAAMALKSGIEQADICRLLIERGASFDHSLNFNIGTQGAGTCISELEDGLHDDRYRNMSLLSLAVFWANREVVDLLIEKGAPLGGNDPEGRTPLHALMAQHGFTFEEMLDRAKILVQMGADPSALDHRGDHAFHYFLGAHYLALGVEDRQPNFAPGIAEFFHQHGVDVLSSDCYGRNPVDMAKKNPFLQGLLSSLVARDRMDAGTSTATSLGSRRVRL